MEQVKFYVNGDLRIVDKPSVDLDLLTYLRRDLGLCGSKRACGIGGCGSCTVTLSKMSGGEMWHVSVNACIVKVCSLHQTSITTVEGVGNPQDGLHPIQERIYKSHGSQCGFCTPGMVMSMYSLMCEKSSPDVEDIASGLGGNLCRCTGYNSIMTGFKSLCHPQVEGHDVDSNGDDDAVLVLDESELETSKEVKPLFIPDLLGDIEAIKRVSLKNDIMWHRPSSVDELRDLMGSMEDFELFGGGTGNFKQSGRVGKKCKNIVQLSHLDELKSITIGDDQIEFGSALTVHEVLAELQRKGRKSSPTRDVLIKGLSHLASPQIRNVATMGGWLMWDHPCSDIRPILLALRAKVRVLKAGPGDLVLPVEDVMSRRGKKFAVLSFIVPVYNDSWQVDFYHKARRKNFDLAIANACILAKIDDNGIIKEVSFACGGTECDFPGTNSDPKAPFSSHNQLLVGMKRDDVTEQFLRGFITPDRIGLNPKAPGYLSELRRALLIHFFESFFSTNNSKRTPTKPSRQKTSRLTYQKPDPDQPEEDPVTRPIAHLWAAEQACGTAIFVDDIPPQVNELQVVPIQSKRAHANIVAIDFTQALEVPGVVGKVSHEDLDPGRNAWGLVFPDEPVFAGTKVEYYGQIIAALLCETMEAGQKAAELVRVQYLDLPPILSIREAIEEDSLVFQKQCLSKCQLSEEEQNLREKFNLKGSIHLGGQETFYLEPHSVLVTPTGEKDELIIYHSTQEPCVVQDKVSKVLNLPQNKIIVKVKRVGGAFGGKERMLNAIIASVAARKTKRPCRLIFSRETDVQVTGHRHELLVNYDVDFDSNGKLIRTDFKCFPNAGVSVDLSVSWAQALLCRINGAYALKNFIGECSPMKTNTVSNTAMRGFGSPEGTLVIEYVLERIAHNLGKDSTWIREVNMARTGDELHFGDGALEGCTISDCWQECKVRGKYDQRVKGAQSFNRENQKKKRGVSMTPLKFAPTMAIKFLSQGAALVRIYKDGSVLVSHGGIEMGQGLNTKMVQVASRALGVSKDKIHIMDTSSETVINATATGGSTGTDFNGPAVLDACQTLLTRLEPVKKENPKGTWEDWISAAYMERVNLSAVGFFNRSNVSYDFATNSGVYTDYFTYGAGMSEVEVDCATGEVTVLSTQLVLDVGKSLNPAIDIGQIEGSFVQALGYVTTEQLLINPESGELVTCDPSTYKIPTVNDIPGEFNVHLLRNELGPTSAIYSSKGIGEPAFVLGTTTVALAIRDAVASYRKDRGNTNWFQIQIPATVDKIKAALDLDDFQDILDSRDKIAVEM